jgi:hypothetical protein
MRDADRFRLLFGPYKTPRFRLGRVLRCEVRGEVRACGLTDARIPWPFGQGRWARMLVVYRGLARAVRRESAQAVAHWWGVTPQTVTKWRKALGVGRNTEGSSQLRSRHAHEPWAGEARKLAWAKARDPQRRARISAAKKGKPRPRYVIEAMQAGRRARPDSKESRRRMSEAQRRRWARLRLSPP